MSDPTKVDPTQPLPGPAACPHCKKLIEKSCIKFDPTPAGTFLLTFKCPNPDCNCALGFQLATKETVFPGGIEIAEDPDVTSATREILDKIRKRPLGGS